MQYFIIIILAAAVLQSEVKLTLLPRLYRWGVLAVVILPVFIFQKHIAGFNIQGLEKFLNDGNNLKDFCMLVVIQELISLVAGLSLVKEYELGRGRHYWKYISLLPSLLMPVAALYLQALAFNYLTRWSFSALTWMVAGGFLVAGIAGCELIALFRRARLEKVSSALNASWLLLMLAIFLPVVAVGELSGMDMGGVNVRDLKILAALFGFVVLETWFFYYLKKYLEKRKSI